MSATALPELVSSQAEFVERALRFWQGDGEAAPRGALTFAEVLSIYVARPRLLLELERDFWDRIRHGRLEDYRAWGDSLLRDYDASLRLEPLLRRMAASIEQSAGETIDLEELARAVEAFRQQRARFEATWPWFDQSSITSAEAEHRRGESLDVDEAFQQIAGVDGSGLARHLADHKRKRQTTEQG